MRVSLAAAARSMTTVASLWVCKNVAGMVSVMGPSTVFSMMFAFSSPHAVRNIFLALRIVATPMVSVQGGTGSCEPKLMVISSREMASVSMMREVLVMVLPGSLVAMLPMRPMPSTMMSRPPLSAIVCSYARQCSCTSSCPMVPSGEKMLQALMSTLSRNSSWSLCRLLFLLPTFRGKYS